MTPCLSSQKQLATPYYTTDLLIASLENLFTVYHCVHSLNILVHRFFEKTFCTKIQRCYISFQFCVQLDKTVFRNNRFTSCNVQIYHLYIVAWDPLRALAVKGSTVTLLMNNRSVIDVSRCYCSID